MLRGKSDLLVVGAGPAGCAAGIEAARAGLDVCVVDRARFPRPKTCGDAVSNEASRTIAELGAGDAFARAPRALVAGASAVFPDGSRVRRSYGDRPGYICGRVDLDNLLKGALEAAGARVVEGVHVRELTKSGERVTGARADGWQWDAAAVIAADGSGSVAWAATGQAPPRGAGMGVAATAYYEDLGPSEDPDHSEHYFEHDLPCGYAWIFPPVDGVSNIGVYQRTDRYRASEFRLRELLDRFIERQRDRFAGSRQRGGVKSWALPLATRRPPIGVPGLLACGDAGRLIDPLTGEGIWQALRSGMLAGGAAARALGSGGLDRAAARRFRLACARAISWPSAARVAIQRGMEVVVDLHLYRLRAVRTALEWGYGAKSLEVSKSVGG